MKPGVGPTPGRAAWSEARARPHRYPCAGYRIAYTQSPRVALCLEALRDALNGMDEGARSSGRQRMYLQQDVHMEVAKRMLERRREAPGRRTGRGETHMTAEQRLLAEIGRWEGLAQAVRERGAEQGCFEYREGRSGRRSFSRVALLRPVMERAGLTQQGG